MATLEMGLFVSEKVLDAVMVAWFKLLDVSCRIVGVFEMVRYFGSRMFSVVIIYLEDYGG